MAGETTLIVNDAQRRAPPGRARRAAAQFGAAAAPRRAPPPGRRRRRPSGRTAAPRGRQGDRLVRRLAGRGAAAVGPRSGARRTRSWPRSSAPWPISAAWATSCQRRPARGYGPGRPFPAARRPSAGRIRSSSWWATGRSSSAGATRRRRPTRCCRRPCRRRRSRHPARGSPSSTRRPCRRGPCPPCGRRAPSFPGRARLLAALPLLLLLLAAAWLLRGLLPADPALALATREGPRRAAGRGAAARSAAGPQGLALVRGGARPARCKVELGADRSRAQEAHRRLQAAGAAQAAAPSRPRAAATTEARPGAGPRTSHRRPAARPNDDRLRMPSAPSNDYSFMAGCWRTDPFRHETMQPQPGISSYCFDATGNGQLEWRRGRTACRTRAHSRYEGSILKLRDADTTCNDGSHWYADQLRLPARRRRRGAMQRHLARRVRPGLLDGQPAQAELSRANRFAPLRRSVARTRTVARARCTDRRAGLVSRRMRRVSGSSSTQRTISSLICSFRFLRLQIASSSGCGRVFSWWIACSREACLALSASMWSTVLTGDLRDCCGRVTLTLDIGTSHAESTTFHRLCITR